MSAVGSKYLTAIATAGLVKSFGRTRALDGLDLRATFR